MSLTIRNVTVEKNKKTLLTSISVDIALPSFCAIIGLNGAGKTTLLQTICGLITPTQGDIKIKGKAIARMSQIELARQLAWVPASHQVPFAFRSIDLVLMGRYPSHLGQPTRHDHECALKALAATDAEEFKNRDITELSTGERQRVFLARALASDASIIIMDEPCAALDVRNATAFLNYMKDACEVEGRTFICSLHDLNHVIRYTDSVVGLQAGLQLFASPTDQLLSDMRLERLLKIPIRVIHNKGEKPVLIM